MERINLTEHPKTPKDSEPRTPQQYARIFFTGMAMGAADIVPGVSGGTMAFILGIYADLINAIKSVNLDVIRKLLRFDLRGVFAVVPWRFLVALLAGIGTAIVTMVSGLEWALENTPVYLFSFFTGLIVASIIAVGGGVKWGPMSLLSLGLAAVGAFIIVGLRPQNMPNTPPVLFFSGMIAISAMILPGVSGSFLLLVLGQYEFVIGSVKSLLEFENIAGNIVSLGSLAVGIVVGIVIFSRFLSWLLGRYENNTVAALVGFMIGSLRVIYPFKAPIEPLETYFNTEEIEVAVTQNVLPHLAQHTEHLDAMVPLTGQEIGIALGLMVLGFIVVTALDHAQSRNNPVLRLFGMGKPPAESES